MRVTGLMLALSAAICSVCPPVAAEEVTKRWRLGLAVGMFNAQDEVRSDAANILNIVDDQDVILDRFIDPRSDSAITGNLEIKSDVLTTLSAQFAISRLSIIEGSVGYQQADVGDIEVQYMMTFGFGDLFATSLTPVRVPAGEMERIPIQLSNLWRLRPEATFNPYFGGGIGYTVVGFEASPEFDQLSLRLDSSTGGQTELTGENRASIILAPELDELVDFDGARVDARDTFEWHVAAGAEYTFASRWAAFLDFRYTFSSRSLSIGFNGAEDLGISVPQSTVSPTSKEATDLYGPVFVVTGGLVENANGDLVTGLYYINGGRLDFGGFSAQLGIRRTF